MPAVTRQLTRVLFGIGMLQLVWLLTLPQTRSAIVLLARGAEPALTRTRYRWVRIPYGVMLAACVPLLALFVHATYNLLALTLLIAELQLRDGVLRRLTTRVEEAQ